MSTLPTDFPKPVTPGSRGSFGSSNRPARADHEHPFPNGTLEVLERAIAAARSLTGLADFQNALVTETQARISGDAAEVANRISSLASEATARAAADAVLTAAVAGLRRRQRLVRGVDLNTVADTLITGLPAAYQLQQLAVFNGSAGSTITTRWQLYTGAGATGTSLAANTTGNGPAPALQGSTLTGAGNVQSSATLYFRVTTPNGAPATGDVLFEYLDLS